MSPLSMAMTRRTVLQKHFKSFHGITPSQARESGASLRSFAPLHIKITMEGGTMLDYRIVEKAPFTIVGVKRPFNSETSYQEIPKSGQSGFLHYRDIS